MKKISLCNRNGENNYISIQFIIPLNVLIFFKKIGISEFDFDVSNSKIYHCVYWLNCSVLFAQSGKVYLQRCNSSNSSSSNSENKPQVSCKTLTKFQDLNFPPTSKQTLNLFDELTLELKLVSSASTSPPSSSYPSICTLDKVKSALERAEKETVIRKRSMSMSMSMSKSCSPRSNSSSSIQDRDFDHEERYSGSFAAGCPSCLLYVLILKSNPRCPRCNCEVPVPVAVKKPRIDLNMCLKYWKWAVRCLVLIFCKDWWIIKRIINHKVITELVYKLFLIRVSLLCISIQHKL